MAQRYRIGDIITAKVTGVQAYGVFLSLDKETQGLIHISECKHGYMNNVYEFVKVGDEVTAKIIDVDEFTNKISLSIRALEKLDVPTVPTRTKRSKKRYIPSIGFASLAHRLPHWIKEAQEKFVYSKDKTEVNNDNSVQ